MKEGVQGWQHLRLLHLLLMLLHLLLGLLHLSKGRS